MSRPRLARRRRSAGFTLLEILVAFVLLGLVGTSLLELFQGGMRTVGLSAEYSHAALLARSKLAELQAYKTLEQGESSGEFDTAYRWHLRVFPYEPLEGDPLPPTPGIEPLLVELTVSWGDDSRPRDYRLTTLALSSIVEGRSR